MSVFADYQMSIDSEVRVPNATIQLVQLRADVPTGLVIFDRDA